MNRLLAVCTAALSLTLFACGGDDGGGGTKTDAKVFQDGSGSGSGGSDGSSGGLTGLGQKCDQAANTCPANAPDCIAINLGASGNSPSYCTPKCVTNGTATGMNGALGNIQPPPSNPACMAAYSQSVGTGQCAVVESYMPMDNPPKNGTNYTNVNLGCAVVCDATNKTCPAGMTPNMSIPNACLCFPN